MIRALVIAMCTAVGYEVGMWTTYGSIGIDTAIGFGVGLALIAIPLELMGDLVAAIVDALL